MTKHLGAQTIQFPSPPSIFSAAAIGGVKEGEGPLKNDFDEIITDDRWDTQTWEQAESKLQKQTALIALNKAKLKTSDINYILGGDLMNQCAATHYGIRDLQIPFFGLYGACSTMVESLSLGAVLIDGDYADRVMCMTSSHFCSAEKQFRFPLEYGGQRTPTAQWTATAAGCAILTGHQKNLPCITHITTGKIIDYGVSDLNNMGAAMAPAAVDTLRTHFKDTGFSPSTYDLILTGDLGVVGSDILCELLLEDGYDISELHSDCGKMIFDLDSQDVHAGGSGCGCCAGVLCGHIYKKLLQGSYRKILVMATGALMSPTVIQQGETIPGIAHAITIEHPLAPKD